MMAEPRRAELKDQTDISGSRVVIIEARFYDDIQEALLQGALKELEAAGVGYDVISVPGALEIPAAIAIASMESSRALMDLSVARSLPLGNGIITVNTTEQAWERARADRLNKGGDAARAALTMMRIKKRLAKPL